MADKKIRNWCATFFTKPTSVPEGVTYLIMGEEICPTTNNVHWQSYLETNKPMRMSGIKKLFNDKTVHLEPRAGTQEQAINYCKKDGKFEEFGEPTKAGKRTDLKKIADDIMSGKKTIQNLMVEDPETYCRYRNGLKDIQNLATQTLTKEFRQLKVTVLSGPTGCGKTRQAMEKKPFKIEGSALKWWDGYMGEKTILIDEYNNDIPITEMLNLLDGYELRLPIKGGFTYANWDEVIITTNLKENELHPNSKLEHRRALFRRIHNFVSLWDEVVPEVILCSGKKNEKPDED